MIDTDLFTETWLYKDGVAVGEAKGRKEGKKEGREEGKQEGALQAKRSALRTVVNKRFPTLGPAPEIDQIESPEALDNLLSAILDIQTVDDAQAALQAALRVTCGL